MAILLLILTASVLFCASESARSPAMFIFGDSLTDNGNNNYIPSIARANYLPYGIDFGMPTGRFCNGMTVMDYAAKYLGFQYPPPYLSLSSNTAEILRGVNYASAAAGILDETGENYGPRITFSGQIALFAKTVRLQLPLLILNSDELYHYIENSLFVINIGSNDYINNYLLPKLYTSSLTYSGDEFAEVLIDKFGEQLENLYKLGARKMILVGIGPLGCIPSQLSMNNSTGRCIDHINDLVMAFNRRLVPLMTRLNASLPGSFFVYDNIYDTFLDIVYNPFTYGFEVSNQACCGSGKYGGTLTCLPLQTPCGARDQYVFWDSFHPTQASNAIIAERSYGVGATDCYPISAMQLAEL